MHAGCEFFKAIVLLSKVHHPNVGLTAYVVLHCCPNCQLDTYQYLPAYKLDVGATLCVQQLYSPELFPSLSGKPPVYSTYTTGVLTCRTTRTYLRAEIRGNNKFTYIVYMETVFYTLRKV